MCVSEGGEYAAEEVWKLWELCRAGDEKGDASASLTGYANTHISSHLPHFLSFHTSRYQQLSPDGSSSGYSGQTASGGQRSPSVSGGAGGGGDGGGGGGGGGDNMAESSYERRSGGSAKAGGRGLASGSFSSTPTSGLQDPAVAALMANPVWCESGGEGGPCGASL